MIQKVDDGSTISFRVFFTGRKAAEEYTVWYEANTDTIEEVLLDKILKAFETDHGLFIFTDFESGVEVFLNTRNIERIEV